MAILASLPSWAFDEQYSHCVIGLDEVGYGPWAGPVTTAAVQFLDRNTALSFEGRVKDSKQLSPQQREILFEELTTHQDIVWTIGEATVVEIDQLNIRQATLLAMTRALALAAFVRPAIALVDGTLPLQVAEQKSCCVIKGDQKSLSISAASIIAKVTRDRLMATLHLEYPMYDWINNVGYGTKRHQEGLALYGPCPHHRQSYAPIAKLLAANSPHNFPHNGRKSA